MEIDSVSSTSVTLQWMPPEYRNGVVTKYSVHFDGIDIDSFGDEVSNMMTGTVEGLSPDTVYVLELKAYTRVGPGPPISVAAKTRKLINNNACQYKLYIKHAKHKYANFMNS